MEKEFIPYDLALQMKQLGFDEPCLMCYYGEDRLDAPEKLYMDAGFGKVRNSLPMQSPSGVTAPLWQQAFRWFREEFDITASVYQMHPELVGKGHIKMFSANFGSTTVDIVNLLNTIWEDTYEEAQEACLRKLIQLVKEKQ